MIIHFQNFLLTIPNTNRIGTTNSNSVHNNRNSLSRMISKSRKSRHVCGIFNTITTFSIMMYFTRVNIFSFSPGAEFSIIITYCINIVIITVLLYFYYSFIFLFASNFPVCIYFLLRTYSRSLYFSQTTCKADI